MTSVHFEAGARRLRLAGAFREADLNTVRDAVDAFGQLAKGHLTVDLTAVTDLDTHVARYLVHAKSDAVRHGWNMTLLRKLDSAADHALNAADAMAAADPGECVAGHEVAEDQPAQR